MAIYFSPPGGDGVLVKARTREELYKTVDALREAERTGRVIRPPVNGVEMVMLPDGAFFTIKEPKPATVYEARVINLPVRADVIEVFRSGNDRPVKRLPKVAYEAVKPYGKPIRTAKYTGWLVEKSQTAEALAALREVGIFTIEDINAAMAAEKAVA